LTETIHALKQLAVEKGVAEKKGARFYQTFLDTVRRYGRVREMELMARYFLVMKSPILPLSFTPLGMKLMMKGKVSPEMPKLFGPGKLDAIFRKIKELEASS
jgi:heterodisulfide reductase subunit C